MIQIVHNPRCSKSRDGLAYLVENNIPHQVISYLDTPLTKIELEEILKKLGISPIELVRKNESIWKEKYKDQNLSEEELINIMIENPKLIERPIFIKGSKAVIGRPIENIEKIL